MVELNLSLGDANAQETALILLSLSSVLQGVFLIIIALKPIQYIRKENAHSSRKRTHSRKHHWKRR